MVLQSQTRSAVRESVWVKEEDLKKNCTHFCERPKSNRSFRVAKLPRTLGFYLKHLRRSEKQPTHIR